MTTTSIRSQLSVLWKRYVGINVILPLHSTSGKVQLWR